MPLTPSGEFQQSLLSPVQYTMTDKLVSWAEMETIICECLLCAIALCLPLTSLAKTIVCGLPSYKIEN